MWTVQKRVVRTHGVIEVQLIEGNYKAVLTVWQHNNNI